LPYPAGLNHLHRRIKKTWLVPSKAKAEALVALILPDINTCIVGERKPLVALILSAPRLILSVSRTKELPKKVRQFYNIPFF